MTRIKTTPIFLLLCIACVHYSHANMVNDALLKHKWQSVITFTGGAAHGQNLAHTQIIPVTTSAKNYTFVPGNTSGNRLLLGIYSAFEHQFYTKKRVQLGISYYQPIAYKVSGTVSASTFNTPLSYHYSVSVQQVLAESKWLVEQERLLPYLSGGIGVGWATAKHFISALPNHFSYDKNTQVHFSYSIGTGIDLKYQDHLRFGMGYRFMSFGSYQTAYGTTKLSTGIDALNGQNVYVNAIVAQVSFL